MHNDDTTSAGTVDDCAGRCTLHEAMTAPQAVERRAFIRAAGAAFASLGFLGLGSRAAEAMGSMPISEGAPLPALPGDRPDERRYPVPPVDGVTIDKDNSVIVARAGGKVYAFSLACPHQNTALRWEAGDNQFFCTKHKSHYRADGTFVDGRATRDMDRLPIRKEGAVVVVDIDGLIQQDEHQKEWSGAFVAA